MRKDKTNIILTGFMGTGKTAVGRELARLLDMRLVDVDAEIQSAAEMSINEIFAVHGEERFRQLETDKIKAIVRGRNTVLSMGGGAVLREENMQAMRANGIIVCLTAGPATILARVGESGDRPLLQVERPLEKIKELLESRRPFYENADIIIDTENKTPLHIAEEIVEKVKAYGKDTG